MQLQSLLIDAHVHLYPQFQIDQAITSGLQNMQALQTKHNLPAHTTLVWLMTEGMNYNGFAQLTKHVSNEYKCESISPACTLITDTHTGAQVYVFAGRQIVSTEKLEVCALATDYTAPDRQYNTQDTLAQVRDHGAVAALNWAPGKWLFKRGKIVANVLNTVNPADTLISETTMRPTVWPTPVLVKKALGNGFRLVAGSDPLPFMGEEQLIGSYACTLQGAFDPNKPEQSIQTLLLDDSIAIKRVGKRSGPFTFAARQYNIMNYNRKN